MNTQGTNSAPVNHGSKSVTPAAFICQLLIVAVFFTLLNVAVKKVNTRSRATHLINLVDSRTRNQDYDALYVGHSLIEAGINEEVVSRSSGVKSFNVGLGSTLPLQHLLVVNHIRKTTPREKVPLLVYGFFADQLSNPPSKSSIGNAAINYQIEPATAMHFVADTPSERVQFRVVQALPYLNQQFWVWSQVEKIRRKFEAIGMPAVATNKFGRAKDFASMAGGGEESKDSYPQHLNRIMAVAGGDVNAPRSPHGVVAGTLLSEVSRNMIADMKNIATRVVFVAMPLNTGGRHTFNDSPEWERYQKALVQELQQKGITVIDARTWIADKAPDGTPNFQDIIHLNENGAKIFSRRLGRELKDLL